MTMYRCLSLSVLITSVLANHANAKAPDHASGDHVLCVVDPTWPQKPESFAWGAMSGITVDRRDQVYLFNRSQPTVQVYRTGGAFVRSWSTANPQGTHHIKLDAEGNVWLADFRSHVIQKYTFEGKLLLTLGEPGRSGCDQSHFAGPTDMAFVPTGDVFISDGYGNRRVVHFDKQGRFVKAWGEEGTDPGQFALPHAIAADSQGSIYVADRNNARIQVFDTNGQLLAVWDDAITPWGFAVTKDDKIWVCGSSRVRQPGNDGWVISPPADQLLVRLDTSGKVLQRIALRQPAAAPSKKGEVDWVHTVAIDSKGNLYLGDIMGKRAQKFSLQKP
jgi:DNA-binding beta-propeller fold protein YncE